jgi:hypothetical protein
MNKHKSRPYIRGYNWAAGAILRREISIEEVEALTMSDGIDPTDFDSGARDAVRILGQIGIV